MSPVAHNFKQTQSIMEQEVGFTQTAQVGCGIDVHQSVLVATVSRGKDKYETREFGAYTSSLRELSGWLQEEGVTHVAMESTGVYWKPVFNILEENFEIILVNARHIKNVPGHKTDKKDSKWISKLLLAGLLKGSFIPKQDIRELRDLVRYKKKLMAQNVSEKNRMIKVLEDANIKISTVLTEVHGVSGMKIINDLIQGHCEVEALMRHIDVRVKADRNDIAGALDGRVTAHHRFMLKVMRKSIQDRDVLIAETSAQIDSATEIYAVELELLKSIPGLGKDSAMVLSAKRAPI